MTPALPCALCHPPSNPLPSALRALFLPAQQVHEAVPGAHENLGAYENAFISSRIGGNSEDGNRESIITHPPWAASVYIRMLS